MKIKKILALSAGFYVLIGLGLALAVLTTGGSASAVKPDSTGKHGPAGKSNIAHLYLYEKDPSDWSIVDGGAWGKMQYTLSGPEFNYVFNGHELVPGKDYTLIYYRDPWPGTQTTDLGSGTANSGGDLHLMNSVELGMDLADSGVSGDGTDGAKIWLVSTNDVTCGTGMDAWNPSEYLFEHNGIFYTDL